jgi:hypothetical protein
MVKAKKNLLRGYPGNFKEPWSWSIYDHTWFSGPDKQDIFILIREHQHLLLFSHLCERMNQTLPGLVCKGGKGQIIYRWISGIPELAELLHGC